MTNIRKATASVVREVAPDVLEYVLSDETRDSYGDVIEARGWDLSRFDSNPIALFNHDGDFPIGTWSDVRVEGSRLVGKLKLAAEGTSARIDEIIRLVRQGVLKAVSVGFKPLEREAMPDKSGVKYKRQSLLETSLVSVPANPSAVQLARSLNCSDATINLVFGRSAGEGEGMKTRGLGEIAEKPRSSPSGRKTPNMTSIAKRIEDAQERLVALKDQLTDHVATLDDANPDEASNAVTDELNQKIETQERSLGLLKDAEARLGANSEPSNVTRTNGGDRRPFALPAQKIEPKSYAYRAATIKLISHITRQPVDLVRQERYGDDEPTKIVADAFLTRAASAPANMTTSGWASQLVQTVNADFLEDLIPNAVYPGLSSRGLRLNFGRSGSITIPLRSATPTIAGSFVGEGSPIPVRQGAFSSTTLTPKKMAVISTFTREIAEHSTPAIEGLIRAAIQNDTAVSLDTVLLDTTAASSIRPAGLRNGISATTATSGGGFAALVGDIKALTGALVTATNGNVRKPVWIMNPVQAISIALTQNAGGDFPFQIEINGGTLQGFPVIQSPTVPAGVVILVDAADFATVTGDEPRFEVSDQATLHMEDTTPLAIGTTGTPNVVAAPVRSMFQTDSIAVRMILPLNWTLMRSTSLVWTTSVTW